jgi:hypothetical protein
MSRAACLWRYFDGFDGVFYLEDASLGGEGVDAAVVVAPEWKDTYLLLNMFDMNV